ncbi:MAG TPA: PEP-CTERM sorting domain-containing protein [Pirellulales bacterium]|jgi:hypothetical protein|nr:PEP-CTERM sorting domain-containing protein [Pirellulales bacterium]
MNTNRMSCFVTSMRKKLYRVLLIAACILWCTSFSAATTITFGPGDYDNTPNTVTNPGAVQHHNQTSGLFRDVFWWSDRNNTTGVGSPDYINRGNSLVLSSGSPQHAIPGPGPYTALNFTGNSANGGQSYMAVYDSTPGDINPTSLFDATNGLTVSADVLFASNVHSVSAGVVAMYNEGQDALSLLAHQGGGNNLDHARLDLIFQSAGTGTQLASINLAGLTTFTQGEWYKVTMNLSVLGGTWTMNGMIQDHVDPTNPFSALVAIPITSLSFSGSLTNPGNALDLTNPGEIGVMAQANQAFGDAIPDPLHPTVDNVGVSITNFQVPDIFIPEPSSLVLAAFGIIGLAAWGWRGKR